MTRRIRAAAYQFDVKLGDRDANLENVHRAIDFITLEGIDLLVLPEMWSSGFDYANLAAHAAATPKIVAELSEKAKAGKMVIVGSLPEEVDGRIYNTTYAIDADGSIAGSYRKVHLFTPSGEGEGFAAGDTPVVCDTAAGRLGLVICYDLRFPELSRALVDKGMEILVVSAQWPAPRTRQWETLLRARAIENQVYVVGCNRCGMDPALAYDGHSMLISPMGEVLGTAQACNDRVHAEFDFKKMEDFRSAIPCLKERAFEVYAK